MCASYNPPNEYITQFNTRLFNQPEDTLSQAEANQLYLSKRTSDISTAPLTTFQSQVVFNNDPPISNTTPSIPTHLATLAYLTSFYQPITSMSSYLLISVAASTYQTIAGMSAYLTTASAALIYQPISLMTNYLTTAVASTTYLTIANATSTYLSITNAASTYLTQANATSTYLSITNAASTYLTQATAALTYQPISLMTNYLTTALASSTYQTIANMTNYVSRTGNVNEDINGLKTFTSTMFVAGIAASPINTNKSFMGNLAQGNTLTIGNNGAFVDIQSQTTFNNACPISAVAATNANHLTRRDFVLGQQFTTLTLVQANNNTFIGTGQFSQTLSVTGVLTATGNLQTTKIVPISSGVTQEIYYNNLTTGGAIFIGTAGRTMNLYGNANFATNCQVSGTFNTGNITAINNSSTQNIYTTLTTSSGIINLGAPTTGTITNIKGGAIFVGGSANALTISSPTTFQNFCPQTGIDPTVANDLVKLSYLQNNFCDLSTAQSVGGTKNFTSDITAPNIFCKTALYFTDLNNPSSLNKPQIYQFAEVLYFDTNNTYSNVYKFMCNGNTTILINQADTEINNSLNAKGGLRYRYDKIVDEIQTLTTASEVLVFPLQHTTIFTNTGNISATLPSITTDTQIGLRFTFLNLGSVSTITTFTAQSTNKIITIGQVAQVTSSTALINNANNSCSLVIVKLSGVYCWAEYI